jgi:hypothetical protein
MSEMSADLQNRPIPRGTGRLRRGALWLVFGTILMIPKANRLRRRRRAWNLGRVVAGLAGAAMVVLPVETAHRQPAWLAGGIFLLLIALLAAPERNPISVDARARELGALLAVDGGFYEDANRVRQRVKLFVGPDRVWVLDTALRVLFEIQLQQVRVVSLEPVDTNWKLRLDCGQNSPEFLYGGIFAEHFARVAESTVRSRLYRELPVLH